jgi:hypothetical protein
MDSKTYAAQLEAKMINEFKRKFLEKVGYVPIVLTQVQVGEKEYLPVLALDELERCFKPFLPEKFGKKLTLSCRNRYREIVELRNIFCSLARQMRYTCTTIGEHLGGRDHTTVLHNLQTFNDLIHTSDTFRAKYLEIITYIKEKHCVYEPPALEQPDKTWSEPQPAVLP